MTPDYVIFELVNEDARWISPADYPKPDQGHNVAQPPIIRSREELEAFVDDLREAADRVWGREEQPEWCPVCHTSHVDPGERTDAGRLRRRCPQIPTDDPRNVFANYSGPR